MNYELSEQLFLDIWNKFGTPAEILAKPQINKFLTELVNISKGWIILDHYSYINFDRIKKLNQMENLRKYFGRILIIFGKNIFLKPCPKMNL